MAVKSKKEMDAMSNEALSNYLDSLPLATFKAYIDADTKVRNFIYKYGEVVAKAIQGTGLFFTAVVPQSMLESGFGRSIPKGSNNFAGIKYNPNIHSGYVETPTYEVIKGKKTLINQKFAKFSTPEEGFKEHVKVLMDSRYKNARLNAKSPEEQIMMIIKAGYASTPPDQYLSLLKGNIKRVRDKTGLARIV